MQIPSLDYALSLRIFVLKKENKVLLLRRTEFKELASPFDKQYWRQVNLAMTINLISRLYIELHFSVYQLPYQDALSRSLRRESNMIVETYYCTPPLYILFYVLSLYFSSTWLLFKIKSERKN